MIDLGEGLGSAFIPLLFLLIYLVIFTSRLQFPLPPLLQPLPPPVPPLNPSTTSSFLFRKGQISHQYQQNIAYQSCRRLSTSMYWGRQPSLRSGKLWSGPSPVPMSCQGQVCSVIATVLECVFSARCAPGPLHEIPVVDKANYREVRYFLSVSGARDFSSGSQGFSCPLLL